MKLHELTKPKRLVADLETLTYNYGKFIAEPLERGFGVTLGNSLRRILLSSLLGTAIISVKIDGVHHEFSTIPGVVEDITQIILNLKQVRLKANINEPVTLYLDAQGDGEVTAADIQPNNLVEIINPDQHIATLDRGAKLNMELVASSGRGYVPADNNLEQQVIGVIPIDAAFSPVRKANFYVDETRVGQMTNFERLTLEVWTDGSITAKEAISEAANILTEYLRMFVDFDETFVEEEEEIDEEAEKRRSYLSKPVAELELSVRSANCLEAANIVTIRDLVTKTESDMLKYRNFGRKSLNEIKDILADMGLSFGMVLDDSDK
ncbi:DNA-directed RNA polymerase subunit alpha [Candidatus Poribacteria bacterium]|nr:DNA-directed RNA polymerase subunit alpha [Candidatus Poribacteria bacterium]